MTLPPAFINVPLYQSLLETPPDPQSSCPLITVLPAEVRNEIFRLALTEYVDPNTTTHYSASTYFARPAYFAPRRTDTQLLRTCRTIYRDCWLMPHILKEETHWLAWAERAPPDYDPSKRLRLLRRRLETIANHLGEGAERFMEMSSLRVFAQLCRLEGGGRIRSLVSTPHLRFRTLTVTIRHADWWDWETDEPLCIHTGSWIQYLASVLPETVTEVCMELESLERKKSQVNAIAEKMARGWYFKRRDGIALFADLTCFNEGALQDMDSREDTTETFDEKKREELVQRWSGPSTFNGQRWTRDETAPGRLDYYILKVPFRLQHVVERKGGRIDVQVLEAANEDDYNQILDGLYLPNDLRLAGQSDNETTDDESHDEEQEDGSNNHNETDEEADDESGDEQEP